MNEILFNIRQELKLWQGMFDVFGPGPTKRRYARRVNALREAERSIELCLNSEQVIDSGTFFNPADPN